MNSSKTYLCRCEEMTIDDLHKLIDGGFITLEDVKRVGRCTMGPCQGRTCRENIVKEIAKKRGVDFAEVDAPSFRPPAKPIKLGTIAGLKVTENK